jgi:hypothetical protein
MPCTATWSRDVSPANDGEGKTDQASLARHPLGRTGAARHFIQTFRDLTKLAYARCRSRVGASATRRIQIFFSLREPDQALTTLKLCSRTIGLVLAGRVVSCRVIRLFLPFFANTDGVFTIEVATAGDSHRLDQNDVLHQEEWDYALSFEGIVADCKFDGDIFIRLRRVHTL